MNTHHQINVVSSNPAHDKVYSKQHYVKKFFSDFRQVGGFLRILRFPPPIKLKYCGKAALNTITLTSSASSDISQTNQFLDQITVQKEYYIHIFLFFKWSFNSVYCINNITELDAISIIAIFFQWNRNSELILSNGQ